MEAAFSLETLEVTYKTTLQINPEGRSVMSHHLSTASLT
jgi:hypothetical protein